MICGTILQAAFGKSALAVTSFFTYIGLALGFLGSSLSLPFGLFVLIVQRDAEKYIQDQVRPWRSWFRAASGMLAPHCCALPLILCLQLGNYWHWKAALPGPRPISVTGLHSLSCPENSMDGGRRVAAPGRVGVCGTLVGSCGSMADDVI